MRAAQLQAREPLFAFTPSGPAASGAKAVDCSGIHGAAAFLFRGRAGGTPRSLADVQAFFEGYWQLETGSRPIRFGERDTKESLLDLAGRMLEVLHRNQEPGIEIVGGCR